MPFSNLIQKHFDTAEMQTAYDLVKQLRVILTAKSHNLSPEERQKYGSIHEKNKLFVGKTMEYNETQNHLSSPDVDWDEMQKDWEDRKFLEQIVRMMNEASEIATDTRTLHDFDLYQNALTDYDFIKYKKDIDTGSGFETKYTDLKQFMPTGGKPSGSEEENPSKPTIE